MTTIARRGPLLAASIGLAGLGLLSVPSGGAAPRTSVDPCSLTVIPAAVTAGRPDTRVLAETERAVRGEAAGSVPRSSRIRVEEIEEDVSPGSWIVNLDLTEARSGDWRLTLTGDGFECSGPLTVRER